MPRSSEESTRSARLCISTTFGSFPLFSKWNCTSIFMSLFPNRLSRDLRGFYVGMTGIATPSGAVFYPCDAGLTIAIESDVRSNCPYMLFAGDLWHGSWFLDVKYLLFNFKVSRLGLFKLENLGIWCIAPSVTSLQINPRSPLRPLIRWFLVNSTKSPTSKMYVILPSFNWWVFMSRLVFGAIFTKGQTWLKSLGK